MEIAQEQIEFFTKNGFLFIEDVFSKAEVQAVLDEASSVIKEDCPRRILEKSGAVRSFFAPEQSSVLFYDLVRSNRLIGPSERLLENEVYIHQSKINTKHAMVGDWWEWHQDFSFWRMDDGMPDSAVLTAMIYLNEVNEFNGPMFLVPGTHLVDLLEGVETDKVAKNEDPEWFRNYEESTEYMSALTSNLKYTLRQKAVAQWAIKNGIYSAKGAAGSVLFFHGNIFHASSNNLSPWDRHAFLVTYNSLNNKLRAIANPRPQFLAARDYARIEAVEFSVKSD